MIDTPPTKNALRQFPTSYLSIAEPKNAKHAKPAKQALAPYPKTVHATFLCNRRQETEAIAAGKTAAEVLRDFDGNR
jgi:hypothetical protein